MDVASFVRDGHVAVRGAFSPETASACRDAIWDALAERGVSRDDRRTWNRPLVSVPCPEGEPFAVVGTSPALLAAYDELIGPGGGRILPGCCWSAGHFHSGVLEPWPENLPAVV